MKISKRAGTIMAIVFIVLMMGSTIAYSFIQAINFGLYGGQNEVRLPDTNLINYELTIEQEHLALQQGRTVVKYSYSADCIECLRLAGQLEGLANQLKEQVIIELLSQSSAQNQTAVITLTSAENSKIYNNPTTDNIIDGLCEVLINPPVDCTLRKI